MGPCSTGALLALAQVEPVFVAPGAVLLLLHHLLFPAVPSVAPGGGFTFNILLSPTAGSSQVCCLSAGVSAIPSVQERGLCDASGLCTLSPRRLQAVLLCRVGYLPGVFSEKRGNYLFCWDTCLLPPDLFRDSLSTFALTPLSPRLSTKPTPLPSPAPNRSFSSLAKVFIDLCADRLPFQHEELFFPSSLW